MKTVGFCKECGAEVFNLDEIKAYPDVFECPECRHPHAREELCRERPNYI